MWKRETFHFARVRTTMPRVFGCATVLGHVVRGAPPTAFDRLLATRLGVAALTSLAEGVSGVLIGEQRGDLTRTPLAEIAGKTKPISTNLIELARVLAK